MKISNLGITNGSLTSKQPVDAASGSAGDQPAQSAAAGTNAYTPSPDLVRLLTLVQQQPYVRADRVQAAAQRLQQGYYATQASAENTAAAMLVAAD